jgi:hypothetical protein
MTTLTLDFKTFRSGDGGRSALADDDRHLFGDGGGEATLADVIAGSWEELAAARAVACLVCDGELAPRLTTPAGDLITARCIDCGAELS